METSTELTLVVIEAVISFVMALFRYGYARPNEWSRQLPTVKLGEVMRILTKRISLTE